MIYKMNNLLNNAPCGFLSFNDDGEIVLVNSTLCKLLGYEKEELLNQKLELILPLAGRIFYQTHFFPLLKMEEKIEEIYLSLKSKQGQKIPTLINAMRQEDKGKLWNNCVIIPIEKRIEYETEILNSKKKADEITLAQKQIEIELRRQYEKTLLIQSITHKIHQSLDLSYILNTSVTEIRQFISSDRVAIYKFDQHSNFNKGTFVAESTAEEFNCVIDHQVEDHCFDGKYAMSYHQGRCHAIDDINNINLQECYRNCLKQFQIQANLVIPLLNTENLWGLLCIHQCSNPRHWLDSEIEFIKQIADQLAIAIQQADLFSKLETELLERKIVEAKLKEVNDQLQIANLELENTTKAKAEFFAKMNHEIRTPMNGVIGMTELLLMSEISDEQKDYLETIKDSSDTVIKIINDILDFSQIESGMVELEQKPFALKSVLKYVSNLFLKKVLDKSINLVYHIDDDVPIYIEGDVFRLRQILLNLVGNAIKFTKKGQVSISVSLLNPSLLESKMTEEDEVYIIIIIQDTGIGIDGDRQKKLFQLFSQADASIHRKYGGSGLGLVISKNLINLMGGTIWIESHGHISGYPLQNFYSNQDENQPIKPGSTFYFTFKTKKSSKQEFDLQAASQITKNSENKETSNLKILLAEDNKTNQKVAIVTLKKLGYNVDIANNGLEVIEKLATQFYDVILMDMQMPVMDGMTATKRIRQSDQKQPYIIALTGNVSDGDRQKCLEIGMNDYISKPLAIEKLREAIEKCNSI